MTTTVRFTTPINWPSAPKIDAIEIRNLTFAGQTVAGDLYVKYEFDGTHEASVPFQAELNEQVSLPLGPLSAHFHVWLNGQQLCFGLKACIGPLCTDEITTCTPIPQ